MAPRREQTVGRGSVLMVAIFVIALVILSTGVGIVVPRLGDDQRGRGFWLGLPALVLGLVVTGWAVWRLLRAVRWRWRVPMSLGLLVAVYLALWTVGQGVAASFPGHPKLGSRTPADLGLPYESVPLQTADGVALAAWWIPGDNGAAVILLHGAGSTRTSVLDHAEVLADHGYGVLLLDARGHGGSAGRGMAFGWYGERDVDAALDYVTQQPGVAPTRVGIVGLSMGGEVAIGAAGSDRRVRVVVAEGATHRVAQDKDYLEAYGVRGDLQRGIDRATFAVAGWLTSAPEPVPLSDSVAEAQADGGGTPMLLVTAGDVDTERLAAELLERSAPQAVEVWVVPGAGHTAGLDTAPEEWRRRVLGFLDDALAAPPLASR